MTGESHLPKDVAKAVQRAYEGPKTKSHGIGAWKWLQGLVGSGPGSERAPAPSGQQVTRDIHGRPVTNRTDSGWVMEVPAFKQSILQREGDEAATKAQQFLREQATSEKKLPPVRETEQQLTDRLQELTNAIEAQRRFHHDRRSDPLYPSYERAMEEYAQTYAKLLRKTQGDRG